MGFLGAILLPVFIALDVYISQRVIRRAWPHVRAAIVKQLVGAGIGVGGKMSEDVGKKEPHESDYQSGFSKLETATLKEVSLWWNRFKGAFAIGAVVTHFMKVLSLFVVLFLGYKAGVVDWIANIKGGL